MAKSKTYIAEEATGINWPKEADLAKIREELSSDKVMGSTVISPSASISDKIKYKLCGKIVEYLRSKNLSQKELAERLQIDEPEVSRVLHYKIERYSIERLLEYAIILYPELALELLVA